MILKQARGQAQENPLTNSFWCYTHRQPSPEGIPKGEVHELPNPLIEDGPAFEHAHDSSHSRLERCQWRLKTDQFPGGLAADLSLRVSPPDVRPVHFTFHYRDPIGQGANRKWGNQAAIDAPEPFFLREVPTEHPEKTSGLEVLNPSFGHQVQRTVKDARQRPDCSESGFDISRCLMTMCEGPDLRQESDFD